MEKEEMTALLDKVKEQNAEQFKAFKESVQELLKGNISKEDAEQIFKDHFEKMGLNEEGSFKEVSEAVEKHAEEIRKLQEQKGPKTFKERLAAALEENKEKLAAIASGDRDKFVKISLSTEKTTATRSSISSDYRGVMLEDFGQIATRAIVMYEISNVFPISMEDSGGNVRYTDWDKDTITRAAAAKSEGATYPESKAAWIGYSKPVQKIVDSIPITMELLRDVKGVQAEIENFISTNLMLERDSQIYSGTGVAPQLKGYYTAVSAFDAGAYAGTKTLKANIFDLIAVLRTEIMNTREGKYLPNKVLLNPNDILRMDFSKDDNGRYNLPPFISADGSVIKGIEVVESSVVTSNTLLIGDFMFARYYDAEDLTLEFGYIDTQFRDDMITLKGSTHGLALIREADLDGFLKVTDIDAAITAITETVD
jgi:hypothetical protein